MIGELVPQPESSSKYDSDGVDSYNSRLDLVESVNLNVPALCDSFFKNCQKSDMGLYVEKWVCPEDMEKNQKVP